MDISSLKLRTRRFRGDSFQRRQAWLEALYTRYHHRSYLSSDPLGLVYCFDDPADREVTALVAACLAYGNVTAMRKAIESVFQVLGSSPAVYLKERGERWIRKDFSGFRYRVTNDLTMTRLLAGVAGLIEKHGGIGCAFDIHDEPKMDHPLLGLEGLVLEMEKMAGGPLDHLAPRPSRGSACKRWMLYLKWMSRCDEVDPGGWSLCPSRLIAPVDVHVGRVARQLKWTRRGSTDLRTAIEITEALRAFDAEDPLRFDFALTRPGILRELETVKK